MTSRTRRKDVRRMGQSSIAPFIPDENWSMRHTRRKQVNLLNSDKLGEWCNHNGWKFEIKNEGHHWIIAYGKELVEWWPSSAKLVRNKQWDKGVHCYDYEQVKKILEKIHKLAS